MYVASIIWTSTKNEWTERNLITCFWIFYQSSSDHACFDYQSPLKLAQSKAMEQKRLTFDRCRPHSVAFGYY